jgi:hypothetical protein
VAWEISELLYARTDASMGWMLINTESKRTISCESQAEAKAILEALKSLR